MLEEFCVSLHGFPGWAILADQHECLVTHQCVQLDALPLTDCTGRPGITLRNAALKLEASMASRATTESTEDTSPQQDTEIGQWGQRRNPAARKPLQTQCSEQRGLNESGEGGILPVIDSQVHASTGIAR